MEKGKRIIEIIVIIILAILLIVGSIYFMYKEIFLKTYPFLKEIFNLILNIARKKMG